MAAVVLTLLQMKPTGYKDEIMTLTKLTDERLAKLRSDAQRVVDMDSPVSDREWWENLLNAVSELQERRKEALKPNALCINQLPAFYGYKEHIVNELQSAFITAVKDAGGTVHTTCTRCKRILDLTYKPDGAHYCHAAEGGE